MIDVLETLVSVPFAVAVTALLRKKWPVIDGAYVYAVVLVLTILGAVLGHYREAIPTEVWTAAGPFLAAILALGGVQTAQHVARTTVIKLPDVLEETVFDAREAPTTKDTPTMPPKAGIE